MKSPEDEEPVSGKRVTRSRKSLREIESEDEGIESSYGESESDDAEDHDDDEEYSEKAKKPKLIRKVAE